jgi:hypothetical protein
MRNRFPLFLLFASLPAVASAQGFDCGRDPLTPNNKFFLSAGYAALPAGAKGFNLDLADDTYLGPDREVLVQFDLPMAHFRPGDAGGGTDTGLGDIRVALGHVLFGGGLSHLIRVGAILDTATADALGGRRWALVPGYGISLRPLPWLSEVVLVDWERSVAKASAVPPLNRLSFRSRTIFKTEAGFFSSLEGTPSVDFERSGKVGFGVGGRIGMMWGAFKNAGLFAQADYPVDKYTRSSRNGVSVMLGFQYIENREGETVE